MRTRLLVLLVVLTLGLATSGAVHANGGPGLVRQILSGGATSASATGISFRATLGEPIVGTVNGDAVSLGQGFWHGGALAVTHQVYLPLVIR